MTEPILHIEGLDKTIGKKHILKNISMDVRQGEIIGLLGPNGSGKTTLIRIIVGLLKKNSGTITINGFQHDADFEKALESVGAIVENPEFYPYLTGWENLKHFANMHKNIKEDRFQEVIERVGLTNAVHDKVKTYSLGMRQRLGIAQAILHRPNLLILDEPTNGLDPGGMKDFRDHLKELAELEGTSILLRRIYCVKWRTFATVSSSFKKVRSKQRLFCAALRKRRKSHPRHSAKLTKPSNGCPSSNSFRRKTAGALPSP